MKKIKFAKTDEVVYYEKLDNGLEVYMYPKDTAKNFYLTFNVKFGSVDTKFKVEGDKHYSEIPQGTAHFLEHQMFQEEGSHTAFEKFSRLGSSVNAFTTYNYTSYEVIASDNFKENLEILLDYVQNPVFKANSVAKEKGIIKEEIKMYDNTPEAVLNFGLEYNLNVSDNHKYTISGREEDIKEITPEILEFTYDTFYNPGNMFMVLTGKFSPLEALAIIKENQSHKTFEEPKKVTKKKKSEPIEVASPYEERTMDISIPKLKIAYKLDKSSFRGLSDLEIKVYLDLILNVKFGPTSDLLEKLLEEKLILWDLYAAREIRDDYVMISFEIETDYKTEVVDLIREELENIKISKEEVERIKKYYISNFVLHFNDIISVAEDIEDDVMSSGHIEADIMEFYDSLNYQTANNVARGIDTRNETIYWIDRLNREEE